MFDTIGELPVHPLIVHATVILVPVTGLVLVLGALWPRFRRWVGWGPVALGVAALVLVPVTLRSGEALEERLGAQQLVAEHSAAGRALLPWAVGLALAGAAMTWWTWVERRLARRSPDDVAPGRSPSRAVVVVIAVASIVVGVGAIAQTVRAGHTGAEAVWSTG